MAYCKEAVSMLVGVDTNSFSQRLKIFGGQEESVAHCCLVQDTQYCLVEYLTTFKIFGGQEESVAHCRGKQQA